MQFNNLDELNSSAMGMIYDSRKIYLYEILEIEIPINFAPSAFLFLAQTNEFH